MKFIDKLKDLFTDEEEVVETKEIELEKEEKEDSPESAAKEQTAVSEEELKKRREKWQPREPKVKTGYLARYAAMVTSGNRGAILEVPKAK